MDNRGESSSYKRKRVSKARLRFRRFVVFVVILFLVWWFNNYTLKITRVDLVSDKITNPVRITVISDCHSTKYGISNSTILHKVERTDPDIVLILGDMYTRNSPWDIIEIPIELTQSIVDAGYSVYFITGDHDTDEEYIEAMAETGAKVMNYNSEKVNVNGNNIQIFGIDNVYYSPTFDLKNAFTLDNDCYSILMAHIPNYEKFADFGADLTVCADTHGGMIQLPFGLGAAIDSSTMEWFPEIRGNSTVYDKGLFDYSNGTMFITSGIGVSPVPVRFNNRPEIAVIDIQPE
ncbi:MAG: metallophosphoesterase [Ruminococcus sp.]|nr:metallophosphoesterase [Ruminococcus sp.]